MFVNGLSRPCPFGNTSCSGMTSIAATVGAARPGIGELPLAQAHLRTKAPATAQRARRPHVFGRADLADTLSARCRT